MTTGSRSPNPVPGHPPSQSLFVEVSDLVRSPVGSIPPSAHGHHGRGETPRPKRCRSPIRGRAQAPHGRSRRRVALSPGSEGGQVLPEVATPVTVSAGAGATHAGARPGTRGRGYARERPCCRRRPGASKVSPVASEHAFPLEVRYVIPSRQCRVRASSQGPGKSCKGASRTLGAERSRNGRAKGVSKGRGRGRDGASSEP
jgi:hypothetical protein